MTDCSKLINRQLQMVTIKRELERSGQRPPPPKVDQVHYGPCILLSRECGSSGDEVARLVGERLNWHVFDEEIVDDIAQRAHLRKQLVESADEHVRSSWRRILHPIRERAGVAPETYLYHLHEIVLTLGHHGDVVIIGRGAQFLLPAACAVRVRVVAPLTVRTARVAAARQLSTEAAADLVQQCEHDRVAFIRKVFHEDTTCPVNYDLVLNTGEMSVQAAAAAILAALPLKLGPHAEPTPCAK